MTGARGASQAIGGVHEHEYGKEDGDRALGEHARSEQQPEANTEADAGRVRGLSATVQQHQHLVREQQAMSQLRLSFEASDEK